MAEPTKPPQSYVGPVERKQCDDALRNGAVDDSTKALLASEFDHIAPWLKRDGARHEAPDLESTKHKPARPGSLMGLALSGGGIRSATFCLGVLQALAAKNLFRKFDYLSTVSGGGYIGSSLTWWLQAGVTPESTMPDGSARESATGLGSGAFPFGTSDPADPHAPPDAPGQINVLRYLRQHGNYLTPGSGFNFAAALCTSLRGVMISVTFWFLFLLSCMLLLLTGSLALAMEPVVGAAIQKLQQGANAMIQQWLPPALQVDPYAIPALFGAAFASAVALAAAMIAIGLLYSPFTYLRMVQRGKYIWRRRFERYSGVLARILLILLVVGSVAVVARVLDSRGSIAGGGGGVAAALAIAAWLYRKGRALKQAGVPFAVLAVIGSALMVYGLALLAYSAAEEVLGRGWMLVAGVWAVTLAYGAVVNLNFISIHRFYRDRLMETFTPERDKIGSGSVPAAYEANEANLHRMWSAAAMQPFHIINTNVVLVDSQDRTRRLRGGDSFMLTPLYSGSNATGWLPTRELMGGHLTLPTAMAISGAAANPNTGVGGTGLTRNPFVSWLMTIAGASLGYWISNPKPPRPGRDDSRRFVQTPNHFIPGISGGLGNHHEDKGFLQLSDGGHFENLALYELIRRRVRLIILCDGGADPGYSFSDFQVAIRRIEEDFGASIGFDEENHLEALMPGSEIEGDKVVPGSPEAGTEVEPKGCAPDAGTADGPPNYPPGARFARRGFVVGTITYADKTRGVLVYLTTTLIRALSLKTKGYAALNPDFPDQPTADQFFDEDQFEAYRELGYRIASLMITTIRYSDGALGTQKPGLEHIIKSVEDGTFTKPA